MEAKIGDFLESVASFFNGSSDKLPWCDSDIVAGCEKEAAEAEKASLANSTSPLKLREKLYLLAAGYYRSADYSRSREIVQQCLEVEPEWRQAQFLKRAIEDEIKKDGVIGIGIALSTVGLIAGGIAAALLKR